MSHLSRVVFSLLLVAAAERAASAGTIVVFGDHSGRHNLATVLSEQGQTVTDVPRLPDNLDAYDSIWHVGALRALTDIDQKRLADFVGTGGGLYLTGEANGADAMNASVASLVAQLVVVPGIALHTDPEAGAETHAFNAAAPDGLVKFPNQLSSWQPGMAGSIDGVGDRNIVARGPDGQASVAAWRHGELASGGQLIVMMDAGWLTIDDNMPAIAENFATFLERQPAPPFGEPTTEVAPVDSDVARDTTEPTDPETDGVGTGSDGSDDADIGGCSAGGQAGGGSVLGLLAVSLLALRRRRA